MRRGAELLIPWLLWKSVRLAVMPLQSADGCLAQLPFRGQQLGQRVHTGLQGGESLLGAVIRVDGATIGAGLMAPLGSLKLLEPLGMGKHLLFQSIDSVVVH